MKPLSKILGILLFGVIVSLVFSSLDRGARSEPPESSNHPPPPPLSPNPGTVLPQVATPSGKPVTILPVAHTTGELNNDEIAPAEDLLIIEALLEQFRRHNGGNPVGDNDDIMAALRGRNPKSLAYLPADHPALDRNGQLVDRWGTPYRFHALSGKHMEIRSAGPDRTFWNNDDLVRSP